MYFYFPLPGEMVPVIEEVERSPPFYPDDDGRVQGLEEIMPSITVNIYYKGTNGNARKFAEEMESCGAADAIRREEGNLRYDYFLPMADPETVLLIDC